MPTQIYLDNAASTPIHPRALRAMVAAAKLQGNPSSVHAAGRQANQALADARKSIAAFLNAHPSEVVFCASGSEANTLALLGVAATAPKRLRQVITAPIEHPSVLEPVKALGQGGWQVTMLPVAADGSVLAEDLAGLITSRTAVVSIAYANNEIGTIQPIKRIAKAIGEYRRTHKTPYPYLHVDACQATAWLPMDMQALGADLLTLNGAKSYGPRGTAVLYVRRGVALASRVLGGEQEWGRRAGTEDVPGVVGLAAALEAVSAKDSPRVARLRDRFVGALMTMVPDARLNGPALTGPRLANNINISIPGISSEAMVLELDQSGICISAGSACTSHRTGPSHVLLAVGTPKKYLPGALRVSLSRWTTWAELARVLAVLPAAIKRVRGRSLK